jgi:hypothetical protein
MSANLRMNPPHSEASIEAVGEIGVAIAARVVEHRDGANEPPRNGILLKVKPRGRLQMRRTTSKTPDTLQPTRIALYRGSQRSLALSCRDDGLWPANAEMSLRRRIWVPQTTRLRPTREANLSLEKCLDGVSMRSRTVRIAISVRRAPVAATPAHWSGHAIGRSMRRLTPRPRGSDRRLAALTRAAQRKASEIVRWIQGSVSPRAANDSVV